MKSHEPALDSISTQKGRLCECRSLGIQAALDLFRRRDARLVGRPREAGESGACKQMKCTSVSIGTPAFDRCRVIEAKPNPSQIDGIRTTGLAEATGEYLGHVTYHSFFRALRDTQWDTHSKKKNLHMADGSDAVSRTHMHADTHADTQVAGGKHAAIYRTF